MTTLGDMLIETRKKAGLTAHDIAQRTHIMQSAIHNLEDDKLGSLPAAGYVRGYILSYCKVCGAEPTPFLEQFERQSGSNRRDAIGTQPYEYTAAAPMRKSEHEMSWKVVAAVVIIIAVIAGAFYFFSQSGNDSARGLNPTVPITVSTDPEERVPEDERIPFSFSVEPREGRASDVLVTIDGNVAFDGALTSTESFSRVLEAELEIANPENVLLLQGEEEIDIPDGGVLTLTASEE